MSDGICVIIHKAEEGGYWAEIPALKGCVSQGETLAEVKKNITEAYKLWIQAFVESKEEKVKKAIQTKTCVKTKGEGTRVFNLEPNAHLISQSF